MPPGKKATKDYHYSVWVNDEQRAKIDQASEIAGEERASTWLRKLAVKEADVLIEGAKKEKKDRR